MPLAEGPSFSAGDIALLLLMLAAIAIVWSSAAAFGFKFAQRAARGDATGWVLWAVAAVILLVPLVGGMETQVGLAGLVVLALQAWWFFRVRSGRDKVP